MSHGTLSEMEVLFFLPQEILLQAPATYIAISAQGMVFGRYSCLGLKSGDFESKVTGIRAQVACLLFGVMLGMLLNLSEPWL